ncbi:ATP-dependent DNA helicase RecG [Melghiribacillus thermohalophilus]|uniref:ATP-dependent DNA helicase RecG n=1 Tax=Melghiribacillus thermohalophilus TaxID=1324956 RepID=A0A4R3ND25_9BACI|nr:ATP-dependent DNA helicase RecG [Melghiribacillus thermohalophilus]TCT26810.1 ATP-dependent DNA helicase RecG [Melghiribacillus thermohalophilus]
MLKTLPVSQVKGIGSKLEKALNELNIFTVEDLLFYFPSRYDFREIKPLKDIQHNETATIEGKVASEPSLTFYGRKKSRLVVMLRVEEVVVKAVFFNRHFLKNQLRLNDILTVTGKWDTHRLQLTVSHYQKGRAVRQSSIQGVYSLKGDLTQRTVKTIIHNALTAYGKNIEEILPEHVLETYKLPDRKDAIRHIHFPENRLELKHARRRFIYEELLLFQLQMQLIRKKKREAGEGNDKKINTSKVKSFIGGLPFSLTDAQKRSVEEILDDLRSSHRMNRLLQGDVGSGKTAVAAIALYAAISAGKQGALMVPTEILAEQHYESLNEWFDEYAKVVMLTGSARTKERKKVLDMIKNHEADIVVGTHALIQDPVQFSDLGLVIVDEQHRFGVEQRRALREKGLNPDVLFMTATPIPRTLAITAFADMDVSVIDEMPEGRKPVKTYWVKDHMLDRVLKFIWEEIQKGHQAYVISPLIEESEKLDIQNAVDLYHQLQEYFPEDVKIGLMHGRLSAEEKEKVMKAFAGNEIQILVSTTVVEVGVNVPNATVMLIYDAERFGLAQLHQLRGRVGRGDAQSYCILLADPKGETGKERMRIMTETNNGFELSEHDLKLRGPGDFFGKKQSGLPEFKVADLIQDYKALEVARKDARHMIRTGVLFHDPDYQSLLKLIEEKLSEQIYD